MRGFKYDSLLQVDKYLYDILISRFNGLEVRYLLWATTC